VLLDFVKDELLIDDQGYTTLVSPSTSIGDNTTPYFDDTSIADTLLLNRAPFFQLVPSTGRSPELIPYEHELDEIYLVFGTAPEFTDFPDFYVFADSQNITKGNL
jgi:hypothetical protein